MSDGFMTNMFHGANQGFFKTLTKLNATDVGEGGRRPPPNGMLATSADPTPPPPVKLKGFDAALGDVMKARSMAPKGGGRQTTGDAPPPQRPGTPPPAPIGPLSDEPSLAMRQKSRDQQMETLVGGLMSFKPKSY